MLKFSLEMKVKECMVESLKNCHDPTPANVVEGLINAMIKRTPCYKSSAIVHSLSTVVILVAALFLSWLHASIV